MRITIISMFPDFFESPLRVSIVRRAREQGRLSIELLDLREYGEGVHRQIDDTPFGGGPGMVMKVEPLARVLEPLQRARRVLFSPSGRPLHQAMLDRWARLPELALVCGRYEGVDERVAEHLVDEEVSLGDFVLAGGEVAALAVVEGVARLLPEVLGNPGSLERESFRGGLLEEPHYTRPAEFQGWRVPEVLVSGDHGAIERWRQEQRLARTLERRPELLPSPEEDGKGP